MPYVPLVQVIEAVSSLEDEVSSIWLIEFSNESQYFCQVEQGAQLYDEIAFEVTLEC